MKKIICMAVLVANVLSAAAAYEFKTEDFKYNDVDVIRSGDNLNVSMIVDLTDVKVKSNQEVVITPVLTSRDGQIQPLQQIRLEGRNRYYFHKRNNDNLSGSYVVRNGDGAIVEYSASTPYREWMKNSTLILNYSEDGCCNSNSGNTLITPLAYINMEPVVYEAEYVYIPPKAETVKIRQESGSAFIDFPVGKSIINADFRNNSRELAKIASTIDKIKDDKDVTMTGMSIKGFASPEGAYSLNARLAEARTVALKDYVGKLYSFKKDFIKTSSDPEDWQGLKTWVEKSDITNKDGILAIINSDLDPDNKDNKIKTTYPIEYAFLLKNVYPSLRHSDYTVDFTVRSYSNPVEIIKVMKTDPRKLSLSEMYIAAQTMTPGSDEFNETFELAAKMFPEDQTANLNAANAALSRGDLVSAAKYLSKAGNSQEAQYARGVLAAQQKDYKKAKEIFSSVNFPQARKAIDTLDAVTSQTKNKVTMATQK